MPAVSQWCCAGQGRRGQSERCGRTPGRDSRRRALAGTPQCRTAAGRQYSLGHSWAWACRRPKGRGGRRPRRASHFAPTGRSSSLRAVAATTNSVHRCLPGTLRFSNPLDEEAFDASQVQITPEIPGVQISASGDSISIRGRTQGATTYQVTVKGSLKDTFGQTLGIRCDDALRGGLGQRRADGPGWQLSDVGPGEQAAQLQRFHHQRPAFEGAGAGGDAGTIGRRT